MKKLFIASCVSILFTLCSCSKTYTCDCGSGAKIDYRGLNKTQADALKIPCEQNACIWLMN